jgi:hypothetical protein
MATSGSTTFEMNRDQIIAAAMRKAQALAKGQVPDSYDLDDYTEALNGLVAIFQVDGMPLWARTTYTLTLVANQASYVFGVGQAENTPFPLKIHQAILQEGSGTGRIDMVQMSKYDFNLLPQNPSPVAIGQPTNFCYTPAINIGTLEVWPAPDTTTASTYTMQIIYQRPFDDFISASDTPYFPKEWNLALIYGLASLIADELHLPLNDKSYLDKKALFYHEKALEFGNEEASIYVQPMPRGHC